MADEKEKKEEKKGPPDEKGGGKGEAPEQKPGRPSAEERPPMREPPPDPAEQEPQAPAEPYGAQFVRRIHGDLLTLFQEYHDLTTPLDNPHIRRHLEDTVLGGFEGILTECEGIFMSLYPDCAPLEGAMSPAPEQTPNTASAQPPQGPKGPPTKALPDWMAHNQRNDEEAAAYQAYEIADNPGQAQTGIEHAKIVRNRSTGRVYPGGNSQESARNAAVTQHRSDQRHGRQEPPAKALDVSPLYGAKALPEWKDEAEKHGSVSREAAEFLKTAWEQDEELGDYSKDQAANWDEFLREYFPQDGPANSPEGGRSAKGMNCDCGKAPCECGKKKQEKSLEPLLAARDFLKSLSEEGSEFGRKHQMEAYHLAKGLNHVTSSDPGMGEDDREKVAAAEGVLNDLSGQDAFGRRHRHAAGQAASLLDMLLPKSPSVPTEALPDAQTKDGEMQDSPTGEDMDGLEKSLEDGEKSLELLSSLTKKLEQLKL